MFKKVRAFLPSFFITIVELFALEFIILQAFRLIFYFGFKPESVSDLPVSHSLKAFRMGFEFDMIASTYAIFLPCLLILLSDFFYRRTSLFRKAAFIATLILLWLYAFVSVADLPYFNQFGSHLNRQAFLWAASPGFVMQLIFGNFSYYGYLFLFLPFALVIYMIVKRIFAQYKINLERNAHTPTKISVTFILLIPFFVAGARGRLSSKSTTHEGMAIVGDNMFVNQVALNPNFTLFRSLLFQKVKKYTVPGDIDQRIAYARNYLGIKGPYARSLSREQKSDSVFRPYNVVIVCMESMCTYKMGAYGGKILTPNFNALVKQSLYFDRFFASGIHTFNGLFSTCAGYPSMLTDHGLRRYTRQPFTTLGTLLQKKNYRTHFYCTHDPHFDNMQGFFTQNGFEKTFSAFDLPRDRTIGATGVPDHEIYDLFFKTINAGDTSKPFLGFIMTGSDHGPWLVPADIPFKPDASTEEQRSAQYADWAVGRFIETAKKQAWYNNTLFVFLGDHGVSLGHTYEMPLSFHHIPLVLHKPNTLNSDTNHSIGYQPDVMSTVAGILNLNFVNNSFGIDLLKEEHPFVCFTADDKIGCITREGYYFYDLLNQNKKGLWKFRNMDEIDYYPFQKAKADSLENAAKMVLDAAEYFIRRDYFSY